MIRNLFLLLTWFLLSTISYSQPAAVTPKINSGIYFTENMGQWDPAIKFRSQLDGGLLFFEDNSLTFNFYDKKKYHSLHNGGAAHAGDLKVKAQSFKVEFLNSNKNSVHTTNNENPSYENFFIGNDRSKWKGNVKNYDQLWYHNLYNGITYEATAVNSNIKYNFHVSAGADPSQIQLKYTGVNNMRVADNGALNIELDFTEITEQKPYAYQIINEKTVEVSCNYELKNSVLSFEFPNGYNTSFDLVIDPVLVFAAQSGSTADNFGMTATYDNSGNLYTGGTAFDNGYPTSTGAYDLTFNGIVGSGNTDVVISKYNPTGTSLLYSTYFGGTNSEIVTSLIVDGFNNLYLYGATGSSNFPTTSGAYDNTFNGGVNLYFLFNGTNFTNGTDIYISKFNSAGTSLLASTYLGGSDNDGVNHNNVTSNYNFNYTSFCPASSFVGNITEYKPDSLQYNYGDQYRGEIQLDKTGNIYIASSTRSSNFPVVGGFDNTLGGKQDAVVVKLNPNLTSVIWSSYLGGSGNDAGYSLIVNDTSMVYVTGGTYSPDFPTKAGCYKTVYNGGKSDGFITKINTAGNSILKSTYIGTNNYDQSYFIRSDLSNRIYIFGQSLGSMPVSAGVYSVPNTHQFVMRLDGQLNNYNMATVFGSSTTKTDISPSAFSVDLCGNIYMSGWGGDIVFSSATSGMPTTAGAFQTSSPNGYDFYLMALSPNAAALTYATYFGGTCSREHVDGGTSRFDKRGVIYQSVCAGCGGYDDFPVTTGAWPNTPGNPNHSSNCNNGVFKFDFQVANVSASFISSNVVDGCAPLTINFTNTSTGYTNYTWYFGPGDTTSTILNPVKTFTAAGIYTVTLVVKDNGTCNKIDSTISYITVSICTGIDEKRPAENLVSIFPNPSTGNVSIVSLSEIESIFVFDSQGRKIYADDHKTKNAHLNISDFAPGIYFLNLLMDNKPYYYKLIKE
jgi:hypothetical protein